MNTKTQKNNSPGTVSTILRFPGSEILILVPTEVEFKSQLRECLISIRKSDKALFCVEGDRVFCNLYRYAILPIEEYEDMKI